MLTLQNLKVPRPYGIDNSPIKVILTSLLLLILIMLFGKEQTLDEVAKLIS
jgi:hypothetical protein